MEVAAKHQSKLKTIKAKVEEAHKFFQDNATRFSESMRFVFASSLSNDDIQKLQALNKPTLEFNVLEALVSRLRGEFAKQEPGITVRAADGISPDMLTPEFLSLLDFIEAHLRETVVNPAANDGFQSDIFLQCLGGGYGVAEVFVDYVNEMSMDMKINVKKCFDPTLTYFDPLARTSHKGDGSYCGHFYPMNKDDFEAEFGKGQADDMQFTRDGDFNWSYKNQTQDIVMVCHHYEKKKKRIKIVKLSNGHVIDKKHYQELLVEFNERMGFIEQAPIIIQERYSEIERIVRYTICENKILAYDETDYKYLPLVFFDGNSVDIKDESNKSSSQMTRPYAYHARGIQRLKNYAGQCVGSEMENMVQHKFKVAIESIPDDYLDAYKNVQQQSVLMYNTFYQKNPAIPLPPPMEIQRTPTPPIVENTFMGSDQVTMAILGSYDSTLGVNQQDVSGATITQGAIQTSAASYSYVNNYMKGLNRVCEIVADLIPKYYVTPRSLPIMTSDGKRSYQMVNIKEEKVSSQQEMQGMQSDEMSPEDMGDMRGQPNVQGQAQAEETSKPKSINLMYKPHELNIQVEAGVNTSIEKQVALDQMIRMSQASPLFAEFLNTYGLEPILDNLEIRGIDSLKASAQQFMKMKQQQQEEEAQQGDPMMQIAQGTVEAEMQKNEVLMAQVEQKAQQAQEELALKAAALSIDRMKAEALMVKTMADIDLSEAKLGIEQERIASEDARTAIDSALAMSKHHHEVNKADQEINISKETLND